MDLGFKEWRKLGKLWVMGVEKGASPEGHNYFCRDTSRRHHGGHPPMIPRLDNVVDLGPDQKRMSDEDPRRQQASVNKLLEAFFGSLETRGFGRNVWD